MRKKQRSPRLAAVSVIDPELPKKARRLLQEAERQPHLYIGGQVSPLKTVAPAVRGGGAGAVVATLVWWYADSADFTNPGTQYILDLLHRGISTLWPFAAAVFALFTTSIVWSQISHNARVRQLTEARKRCVQASSLVADARILLARAQQAKRAVLESSVHCADLIDRQRNEVALPSQEWEIATALYEYSRLLESEPKNPNGSKVAAVLATRRRAMKASFDGIERRVAALESYADQVGEADEQYRELQQIQQLADGSDDVLDLLARTARHDLAVAELEGMTGEAAAVAAAFSAALASAKSSALIALPNSELRSA